MDSCDIQEFKIFMSQLLFFDKAVFGLSNRDSAAIFTRVLGFTAFRACDPLAAKDLTHDSF